MKERAGGKKRALLLGLEGRVCAVPLAHVIETMRPLPVEVVSGVPAFVLGVAIIRGVPTPVVDLGAVLGMPIQRAERFVTIRAGERQVALSVNSVLGVREIETIAAIGGLPPLLQGAAENALERIGALDEQVLVVLRDGWELPSEVWEAMTAQEAVS
ncbi:MAG: chemotaxis protein CheW [Candidatus Acidiferrum sp.]